VALNEIRIFPIVAKPIFRDGKSRVHVIEKPNCAPAYEYLAIPLRLSSAVPVISPGPNALSSLDLLVVQIKHLNPPEVLISRCKLLHTTVPSVRLGPLGFPADRNSDCDFEIYFGFILFCAIRVLATS
jgi:hypothetical protein